MIVINKPDNTLIEVQCYKCKTIIKLHPMQNMNGDYVNDCNLHRLKGNHEHHKEDEK